MKGKLGVEGQKLVTPVQKMHSKRRGIRGKRQYELGEGEARGKEVNCKKKAVFARARKLGRTFREQEEAEKSQ